MFQRQVHWGARWPVHLEAVYFPLSFVHLWYLWEKESLVLLVKDLKKPNNWLTLKPDLQRLTYINFALYSPTEVIAKVKQVFKSLQDQDHNFEIKVIACFAIICRLIYESMWLTAEYSGKCLQIMKVSQILTWTIIPLKMCNEHWLAIIQHSSESSHQAAPPSKMSCEKGSPLSPND